MAAIEIDGTRSFLGYGLVRPIQRAGGADFVAAGGARLIRSAVGQILGTKPGELRWRPSFGIDLDKMRHKNLDEGHRSLILSLVTTALQQFEPRINLVDVGVEKRDTTIEITVVWRIIDTNNPTNQVLLGPITTEVSV